MIVLLAALSLATSPSSTVMPTGRVILAAAVDGAPSEPEPILEPECWIDRPGLAPDNAPWPKGLLESVDRPDGTLLPKPLDTEMRRRLRCLWRWPLACQAVIETKELKLREKIKARDEQIAALRNDLARVVPDPPKSWPSWALAVGGGVGIVLGGLATYGAIRLLGNK